MSATITLDSRINTAINFIDQNFDVSNGNYCHFYNGKITPWDNEYSPDVSTSSLQEINDTLRDRIFMKQIITDDVILSIKRFDWNSGNIYTRCDYNNDYTNYKKWISPNSPFYVINSEGNVYKCISNNYDSISIDEPIGQSINYINLGDGYIWKFMFGLKTEISDKFLTNNFIPVPHIDSKKDFSQLNTESNVIIGDIPYIHVDNGGLGYTSPPTIIINGDGSGADAVAVMNGEVLQSIQVLSGGSGYTYAEIKIYGNGTGAQATAMIASKGGNGSNAIMELGAFYIEFAIDITGNEDGFAPTTGTYRNVGIVKNTKYINGSIINDSKLNTLSSIYLTNSSGTFIVGEEIIGETSLAKGILYYDPSGNDKYIQMHKIEGSFIDGEILHGQESGESGDFVYSSSQYTNINIYSGEILYKENIVFITRKEIQTEKFVFTAEF